MSKSKPVRHLRDTQASKEHKSKYGEEERTNLSAAGSKKNSINQITKKSSKIDVSSYEVKDVYEKLGANWPQ